MFKNSTILCIIENNYGNDINWFKRLTQRMKRMYNIYILSERPDVKLGFVTTEMSKIKGYDLVRTRLATRGLCFYKDLISINAKHVDGRSAMKATVIEQMKQVRQFGKSNPRGKNTVIITGIHDENRKRLAQVDDVMMCILFIEYHAQRYLTKSLVGTPYAAIERMRYMQYSEEQEYGYVNRKFEKNAAEVANNAESLQRAGIFAHMLLPEPDDSNAFQ